MPAAATAALLGALPLALAPPSPCAGEVLHNGICLPAHWPPAGGAARVWHAAEYDEQHNPVVAPTQPWEGSIAMPFSGGAWWDEQARQFRLWYACGATKNRTCVAASADGVSWAKPPLPGAVLPGTNVVRDVEHYDTSVVWLDHAERNASRRWKMSEAACTYCSHSYGLLSSADGVRWEVGVERTGYVP